MAPEETCKHHEAVKVRLEHMEDSMKTIKRMFWAIIVGILIILGQQLIPDLHPVKANTVEAQNGYS